MGTVGGQWNKVWDTHKGWGESGDGGGQWDKVGALVSGRSSSIQGRGGSCKKERRLWGKGESDPRYGGVPSYGGGGGDNCPPSTPYLDMASGQLLGGEGTKSTLGVGGTKGDISLRLC